MPPCAVVVVSPPRAAVVMVVGTFVVVGPSPASSIPISETLSSAFCSCSRCSHSQRSRRIARFWS
eukprot:4474567-Heterocapsa_arctica.AAC.1